MKFQLLGFLLVDLIFCQDLSKINFYLYTRNNPDHHDIIELTPESLGQSHFNPDHPIIILAHGWNSNGKIEEKGFGADFAEDYLAVGDFNIFSIDWGDLESWANYPHAAAVTKPVGRHAAKLVQLLDDYGVLDNIQLVGHSLGAHVVGFLAKEVTALGLGKLRRLTGLDPAFPFFELAGPDGRVDKSDADFVQIIHTNSGFLWEGCLSIKAPIGHVDFYPNGGDHQPGCTDACFIDCYNMTIIDLLKGGCSHARSLQYFTETIHGISGGDNQMVGRLCDSWEELQSGTCCGAPTAVMGQWADSGIPEGKYYLDVNEETPFAMDDAGTGC